MASLILSSVLLLAGLAWSADDDKKKEAETPPPPAAETAAQAPVAPPKEKKEEKKEGEKKPEPELPAALLRQFEQQRLDPKTAVDPAFLSSLGLSDRERAFLAAKSPSSGSFVEVVGKDGRVYLVDAGLSRGQILSLVQEHTVQRAGELIPSLKPGTAASPAQREEARDLYRRFAFLSQGEAQQVAEFLGLPLPKAGFKDPWGAKVGVGDTGVRLSGRSHGVGPTADHPRVTHSAYQWNMGAIPSPMPPVLRTAALRPEAMEIPGRFEGDAYRTRSFLVTSQGGPEHAKQIAEDAERHFQTFSRQWLGKDAADMARTPVSIRVAKIYPRGTTGGGGATSYDVGGSGVSNFRMTIQGDPQNLVKNTLPHEVLHVVLAQELKGPGARWADEGAASTTESVEEQAKKYEAPVREALARGRLYGVDQLFSMKEYPNNTTDLWSFYGQSNSLARLLIEKGGGEDQGRRKYVEFMRDGLAKGDWSAALNEHYGYSSTAALEKEWVGVLRGGGPVTPVKAPGETPRGPELPADVIDGLKAGSGEPPKLPGLGFHLHQPGTPHVEGVCPTDPRAPYKPQQSQAGPNQGHTDFPGRQGTRDNPLDSSTWQTLDQIAAKDNGRAKPLVDFLRTWARTTTNEDIQAVTDPKFFQQYPGWFSNDTMKWNDANFLVWLRGSILEERLPFDVNIRNLDNDPNYGGFVQTGRSGDLLNFTMSLQSLNWDPMRDIRATGISGGVGMLNQPSAMATFFHEARHAYDWMHGWKSNEAGPELSKLEALASIDPQKGRDYYVGLADPSVPRKEPTVPLSELMTKPNLPDTSSINWDGMGGWSRSATEPGGGAPVMGPSGPVTDRSGGGPPNIGTGSGGGGGGGSGGGSGGGGSGGGKGGGGGGAGGGGGGSGGGGKGGAGCAAPAEAADGSSSSGGVNLGGPELALVGLLLLRRRRRQYGLMSWIPRLSTGHSSGRAGLDLGSS